MPKFPPQNKKTAAKVTLPAVFQMERVMRFELTTLTLARLCSTPELHPHPWDILIVIARVDASKKSQANMINQPVISTTASMMNCWVSASR